MLCNTRSPNQSNKSFAFLWTSLWFPPPYCTCILPIEKLLMSFFLSPCSYLASTCCSKTFSRHPFLTNSVSLLHLCCAFSQKLWKQFFIIYSFINIYPAIFQCNIYSTHIKNVFEIYIPKMSPAAHSISYIKYLYNLHSFQNFFQKRNLWFTSHFE